MEFQDWYRSWQAHHQELHHQIGGTQRGLSLHTQLSREQATYVQLLLSLSCLQVHFVLCELQNIEYIKKAN